MANQVEEFLSSRPNGTYDRDSFDAYVSKRKLRLSCPVIHVTGSNGKGSTINYLEAIYRKAGYKVASFIKPYYYRFNECIRVDGKEISDEDLVSIFAQNRKDFEKFGLTEFEVEVALAYRYVESIHPDIFLVEAGMGGAIDATNIEEMDTRLSIITSISLEHTAYLGSTLSNIALHKAGIIKPDSIALIGRLDEESEQIIREQCDDLDATLHRIDAYHFEELEEDGYRFNYGEFKNVRIATKAKYQILNACLAIEATNILKADFPVKQEDVYAGLMIDPLPGRLEVLGRIILDGAHNPESMEKFCETLAIVADRPCHALFASFKDKNIAVELPALALLCSPIYLTTFDHPRARGESDYFLYAGDHPYHEDAEAALKELLETYPEDLIVITGSLAFVGFMRRLIKEKGYK